jgi:hypothetical protein
MKKMLCRKFDLRKFSLAFLKAATDPMSDRR